MIKRLVDYGYEKETDEFLIVMKITLDGVIKAKSTIIMSRELAMKVAKKMLHGRAGSEHHEEEVVHE